MVYIPHKIIIIFSLLVAVSVPAAVSEDCRSSHADKGSGDGDHGEALKLKLVAIASVLVAGGAGVSFPILGRRLAVLRPENDIFFMIKAFAGGVILATGFVHILPDAFRTLTSPCLGPNPWAKFPFSGFIAMVASIATLMVDTVATAFYKNMHLNKEAADVEAGGGGGDDHAAHPHATSMSELVRQRIISQVRSLNVRLTLKFLVSDDDVSSSFLSSSF